MDACAFRSAAACGPLAGLSQAECSAVARAARGLPGTWWVQRDEDDRGHAALGLVPDDDGAGEGDAADAAPTFLLWRERGAVRLACGWGDSCADLGAHAGVASAMTAVRRALVAAGAATGWFGGACIAPAASSRRASPASPPARRPPPIPLPSRDPDPIAQRLADWAEDACLAWEARPGRATG